MSDDLAFVVGAAVAGTVISFFAAYRRLARRAHDLELILDGHLYQHDYQSS